MGFKAGIVAYGTFPSFRMEIFGNLTQISFHLCSFVV